MTPSRFQRYHSLNLSQTIRFFKPYELSVRYFSDLVIMDIVIGTSLTRKDDGIDLFIICYY